MKRWPRLLALGLLAFLLFAAITLPASVVLSRVQSGDFSVAGVSGSIWNGAAQVLTVGGVRIGALQWELHALPLLTGRARADLNVKRVDGFLQAQATAAPSGNITLRDMSGSLPLSMIPPQLLRGWNGTLNLRFAELTIEDGWPTTAQGAFEVIDATGPGQRPANMGSYKVEFPPEQPEPGVLRGALDDLGGPIEITGTVQLRAENRGYVVDGLVAARPGAPRNVVDVLQFLGPPDEQGRRQLGLEGTF